MTRKDLSVINGLVGIAKEHISGCSYDMVAAWVKGKRRIYGFNMLKDPAQLKDATYPEIAGRHAELHVVTLARMMGTLDSLKRGTLYVVGVRSTKSRNVMLTTKPCKYCRGVLEEAEIKSVVYFVNGKIYKEFL